MNSLNEKLKNINSINNHINESLILSSIICATCVAYAAGPILNTDFMKSVGTGLGNLLAGIGSLFGKFGSKKSEIKISKRYSVLPCSLHYYSRPSYPKNKK